MFNSDTFAATTFSPQQFVRERSEGTVVTPPAVDTSGRGGFNRGTGGPGSSYGVGNLPLSRCPICNCLRNCST